MKLRPLAFVALGIFLVASCSPDELSAPGPCTSITECPLDKLCDRASGTCVPEPPDRMIGAFTCTIQHVDEDLDVANARSEVVVHVGRSRFTFPIVYCTWDEEDLRLDVSFLDTDLDTYANLTISVPIDFSRSKIGMDFNRRHSDSLEIFSVSRSTRYGGSRSGYLDLDNLVDYGRTVNAYLDVELVPAAGKPVIYGGYCPNGLADCGTARSEIGGASECSTDEETGRYSCFASCGTSGECSIGFGVCNHARCTNPCVTDADCVAPLTCRPPNTAGEGRGCFFR